MKMPASCRSACGSVRGRNLHRRSGEVNCSACQEAWARYMVEWRSKNSDKVRANNKKHRSTHPDKPRDRSAQRIIYRKLNAETIRKQTREYRRARPEQGAQQSRVRRARKLSVPSEPYTTQQILDLWGTDCHLCGLPIDLVAPRHVGGPGWELGLHLDHDDPLSQGGADIKKNVKPAHGICNLRKRNLKQAA